jgi:hypothetical protein
LWVVSTTAVVVAAVWYQDDEVTFICCSTFVVSRDRLRSRPKAMYEALYRWLQSTVSLHVDAWCC